MPLYWRCVPLWWPRRRMEKSGSTQALPLRMAAAKRPAGTMWVYSRVNVQECGYFFQFSFCPQRSQKLWYSRSMARPHRGHRGKASMERYTTAAVTGMAVRKESSLPMAPAASLTLRPIAPPFPETVPQSGRGFPPITPPHFGSSRKAAKQFPCGSCPSAPSSGPWG